MAYIPKNAKWYVADLIMEIIVSGDERNVVHRNQTLIRADSPLEAYEKALSFGIEGEISYDNSKQQLVQHRFRGVSRLDVLHDELEDGAELTLDEHIGVPATVIANWIPPKEELSVFSPIKRSSVDYSSKEVINMVAQELECDPINRMIDLVLEN
jgi:hypothetical protein